jgi:hypothetical protein
MFKERVKHSKHSNTTILATLGNGSDHFLRTPSNFEDSTDKFSKNNSLVANKLKVGTKQATATHHRII